MDALTLLQQWLQRHPDYTGSLELHFKKGKLLDVKSHESHKDWLRRQLQNSN